MPMINDYQPNFTDPRILKRCHKALDWCTTYLTANKAQWLSQREIQRQFGSLSRDLGKYLQRTLLICVNPYYSNLTHAQCKTYKLNLEGYQNLCGLCGHTAKFKATAELEHSLDTGLFEYQNKGHREYHPLQNQPKRIKRPLLAAKGYRHEYDIQCSAQTLLLQHARALGLKTPTPALDQYISDRSSVRLELVSKTGLASKTVKQILTALLNGASLSSWYTNTIFAYVNYNREMIQFLREDSYIQQYQRDVKAMWSEIRKHQSLRYKERFNAKMKSDLYRSLEESVRSVIKKSLRRSKNRAFIEHDGWTCERAVDIDRLCWEVKQHTGFVIALEWTIHEYIDSY